MRRLLPFLIALSLLAACGDEDDGGGRPVALALDFQPNAVHAGVYAAKREGLDARQDVDLAIRVPAASTDSLKLLAAGRADLSVVDIHDLGLARQEGSDVVGVGALVQRPLAAVIARADRGIARPRDLEDRRVGVTGLPSDDAVLRAVVEADGGDPERVERVTIGFSAVPSLIAGRVVAAHVSEDYLRTSDRDDNDLIHDSQLIAYLSPGRYARVRDSNSFPFPANFMR